MRSTVLVLALLVLAAGCVSPLSSEDAPADAGSSPSEAERASDRTLFLTADGGLTSQQPTGEPEEVPAGDFYTAWAQGEQQPTWTGPALETGLHVTNVELSFHYTSESATVTTGPQDQGFPEFVVYVGTAQAPMAWASPQGPDVVQQGERVHVEANLSLPAGGLVLPAGAEPIVKLAPVQGQGSVENTRIAFLVDGNETPSHAALTAREIDVGPTEATSVLEESGTLVGSAYALEADEQTTADSYEVEVGPGHAGLQASLERVQGAGIADIDLELLDPDGEVVARSVTPEAEEGLALHQPNVDAIGEGTWTLRVVNYGNAVVEYELTASLLETVEK